MIPRDSPSCYDSAMRNLVVLFIHFIATLAVARSWRRPFPSCGVASPQAPTPDRESLPASIPQFIRVRPHPRRLDGTLGASNSSPPFAIVLKPSTLLALHKAMSKRKYRMLFSPKRRRKLVKGLPTVTATAIVHRAAPQEDGKGSILSGSAIEPEHTSQKIQRI